MYKVHLLLFVFLIWLLQSRSVIGEFPGLFIAEGTEAPGRVLAFQNQELERSFSRSNLNHRTHTTRIGSIEFLTSDEFFLCSGDDSVLIHRSRVGETAFYISSNLVKQVRSDEDEQVWWSEIAKEPKVDDLHVGAIWRWNESDRKAELVQRVEKSRISGTWNGAFDLYKNRVLIGTVGEKSTIYDISKSKSYKQILETPVPMRTFRWDDNGRVWLIDNRGRLILHPDVKNPARFQVALSSHTEFTDFDFQVAR